MVPELANLPFLPGLKVAKIWRNSCFQQHWTCACVQTLDCFCINLAFPFVIRFNKAQQNGRRDSGFNLSISIQQHGNNLSFLKSCLSVRVLPQENIVEGEKYRTKAELGKHRSDNVVLELFF